MIRYIILLGLIASVSLACYSAEELHPEMEMEKKESAKPVEALKSEKEKNGYVIGAALANNLLKQFMIGEDVETPDIVRGFKDAINEKALLSEDEIRNAVSDVMLKVNSQEHYKKMNEP